MKGVDTDLQAYAAGILEGVLSKNVLGYAIKNTYAEYCVGFKNYCDKLNKYLADNLQYIKKRVERATPDDPYWQSVSF